MEGSPSRCYNPLFFLYPVKRKSPVLAALPCFPHLVLRLFRDERWVYFSGRI